MKALKSNIKFLIKKPQCWFSPSFSFSSETLDANPIEKDPVFENKKKFPKKISQFSLSPHVFWLTQGKGMERPYTGDYWFTKEVGHYQCLTCSNKLFL